MRLDLYLSVTGLVKRRAVARELCDSRKVKVNDQVAKPSRAVAPGDLVAISLSSGYKLVEITGLPQKSISKKEGERYYLIKEFIPREKARERDSI